MLTIDDNAEVIILWSLLICFNMIMEKKSFFLYIDYLMFLYTCSFYVFLKLKVKDKFLFIQKKWHQFHSQD